MSNAGSGVLAGCAACHGRAVSAGYITLGLRVLDVLLFGALDHAPMFGGNGERMCLGVVAGGHGASNQRCELAIIGALSLRHVARGRGGF